MKQNYKNWKKINYKDWRMYISFALSIAIIAIVYYGFSTVMGHFGHDGAAQTLMSSSLRVPLRLSVFIVLVVLVIANIVLSYLSFTKATNNLQKIYAMVSFFSLSALLPIFIVIDFISWFITNYTIKKGEQNRFKIFIGKITNKLQKFNGKIVSLSSRANKNVIKILSWVTIPLIAIPFTFVAAFKGANTNIEPIVNMEFSKDKTNLIEVFTDALDYNEMEKYLYDDENLKDFYKFDKFLTAAQYTDRSLPIIMGGLKHNSMAIRKENGGKATHTEQKEMMYSGGFTEDLIDHFASYKDYFSNQHLFNMVNMSPTSNYTNVITGNTKYFLEETKKKNIEIHPHSYEMAKREETSGWGVVTNDSSPDALLYKSLRDEIKVPNASDGKLGSHVFICDHIVHGPLYTSPTGNFAPFSSTLDESYIGLRVTIDKLVAKLKSEGVYDNTMIVMFGDHGTHFQDALDIHGNVKSSEKPHSSLLIKYPNTSEYPTAANSDRVSDRIVYAPYMQHIIQNELDGNTTEKGIDFINNNSNFNFIEGMKFPLFTSNTHVMFPTITSKGKGLTVNYNKVQDSGGPNGQRWTKDPKTWDIINYNFWVKANTYVEDEEGQGIAHDVIADKWGWK